MTAKNVTDIVILTENTLGLTHPDMTKTGRPIPLFKARAAAAGALKRKMAERPNLYTLHNLELTVEYLRRKRKPVRSAAALCWIVEDALRFANEAEQKSELSTTVETATSWLLAHPEFPQQTLWMRRLTRAQGSQREETLAEFEEARLNG